MKGLTNYQKFLVIRPLPSKTQLDVFKNPIIKKDNFSNVDWNKVKFTSLTNMHKVSSKSKCVPLLFHYDYVLERLWNDPIKYLSKFSGFLAITNPDFSIYTNMNIKEIEHNIFRNRWFASWAQYYHYKIIPTISWGSEETFKLCFEGLPKESIVMISTVGCLKCKDDFLLGFNEMKRILNPSLIIVRGKLIPGMVGKFIFIDFKDTFNIENDNNESLNIPKLIEIEEIK